MGWHTGGIVETVEDIEALQVVDEFPEVEKEVRLQLTFAKSAAKLLLDSGTLGKGKCRVDLSGHASPGHEGIGDAGADMITVHIYHYQGG